MRNTALLVSLMLIFPSSVWAERFICEKPTQQRMFLVTVEGDCKDRSLCSGFNNQGLNPRCIEARGTEWNDVASFKKIDKTVVVGSRIVDMTQAEIDAIILQEQQRSTNAETQRLSSLDDGIADLDISGTKLTRVENAIDNIQNLADAKRFLKRLVRFIATQSSNP